MKVRMQTVERSKDFPWFEYVAPWVVNSRGLFIVRRHRIRIVFETEVRALN